MTGFWAAVFFFGLLIFFHELGHFILAKLLGIRVLKFSLGFGPRVIGKKIGDTEYIISAIPLGGYVKPLGEDIDDEIKEKDRPMAFNYQPVWKRAAVVFAGPTFNFILAYIIFVVFLSVKLPVAIPDLSSIATTIEDIVDGSPAMKAGLIKDDTIVSINKTPISGWNEMAEIFSKNPGKELHLKIKRKGNLIDFTVIPEPTRIKDEKDRDVIVGRIGISKKLNVKIIEGTGIIYAPLRGIQAVYEWSVLTLQVVGKLFTGDVSAKQLGGPILIVDTAAKAASVGAFAYFNLIAIMSINLAILNLFPIPVLDGGHLIFMSIEALRGKPLSDTVIKMATKVGMALLILLIAFVFYNDIMRVIVPWIQKIP